MIDLAGLDIASLDWEKGGGLLPAVVQDADSGAVLMLAYMNPHALEATLASGRVTFWSRSKGRLWVKGETSGNFLELRSMAVDCDRDTLLILAAPHGPACHTGTRTCFGADAPSAGAANWGFLATLEHIIGERITNRPEGSYTARLLAEGTQRMAQKVGEEGVELALAAVAQTDAEVLGEAADLVFHVMLLLQSKGLSLTQAVQILESRHAGRAG